MGKALSNENSRLGKPKLAAGNIGEKKRRLAALQKSLPADAKDKLHPAELAEHLTNREESALEYYIRVRFKKFLSNAPTWAEEEPPRKVRTSRSSSA